MFRSLYSSLISSLNHAHPGVGDYQFLGLSHCAFIGDFISNSRSQLNFTRSTALWRIVVEPNSSE